MQKLINICLVFIVLCTEMTCTKVFQPIKKLDDPADSKKFGELCTELSANLRILWYISILMKDIKIKGSVPFFI